VQHHLAKIALKVTEFHTCNHARYGRRECAGDETYSSLQKVVKEMFATESLTNTVTAAGVELKVQWHLCSDHKLVALMSGFGGSGCNKPCFRCPWNRTSPFAEAEEHSAEALRAKSQWATKFLVPIMTTEAEVFSTRMIL
jgi:hypothetical protein